MNAELQSFVRDALSRGMTRERIRETLLAARWRAEEIDGALAQWADGEPGLPVPRRRMSLSAREAFLHLVLFATLYIFAFDVGALLFVLIELRFRDAVNDYGGAALDAMRWSTSGAITSLPIFLWMTRIVNRSLERDPEKRASGVRRWLTYLTLFVAALVLIGDFATLVSHVLSGELGVRFVLKTLVVFAIAGVVFGHYLGGLRADESEAGPARRRASWLGRAGVVAGAIAIVAGLVMGGTPQRVRARDFDARRVDDLQMLQGAIERYAHDRHALPPDLGSLVANGYSVRALDDPRTGLPFVYERVDSLTYRLGATFETADTLRGNGSPIELAWRHPAGRHVFTRQAALPDESRPPAPPPAPAR